MEGGGRACKNVCLRMMFHVHFGFIDMLWAIFFLWIEIVKARCSTTIPNSKGWNYSRRVTDIDS